MKKILLLGAGLSTSTLIEYLLKHSTTYDWKVLVGDANIELAKSRIKNHERGEALTFNALDEKQRDELISGSDIVISMLPVKFHYLVACDCVKHKKNLITASYISAGIKNLEYDAVKNHVLILNEIGVDPGIDHMSAKRIIDKIKEEGGHITTFDSSTGGLVAPGFENNPWRYKFTWNPRNVVLAGKNGARFYHNKKYKHIPYHKIFSRIEKINIQNLGEFEVYANRDSLKYQLYYGLDDIDTMFRGTIRRPGFCSSWDVLVQLGITDDTFVVEDSENLTYRDFVNCFLAYNITDPVEKKVANYLGIAENSEMMEKLKWLGIFEKKKIGIPNATPALILQNLLENKWKLEPNDKDMVLMHHIFEYTKNNRKYRTTSSMVVIGKDQTNTAMAQTVGLPIAIATKLLLLNKISFYGIKIPVMKEIYEPVLNELEEYQIRFNEDKTEI